MLIICKGGSRLALTRRYYINEHTISQYDVRNIILTETQTMPDAANKHLPILLLGAGAFVVTADLRVIVPLLPIIAREFSTSVGTAGLIVTAYTVPYGLFQLVYGPLGDRIGKLRVMAAALAFFAVGTAACGLAPNLALLIVLRALTGVAAAAVIPLSLAYIGDTFQYKERQAAIGQFLTAIALGSILSTSLGGIVGNYVSWRWVFLLYGIASLAVFGVLWRATRRVHDIAKPESPFGLAAFTPYLKLLQTPASLLVIGAVAIEGFFFFGGFSFLGGFLSQQYHFDPQTSGLILGVFGFGILIYTRTVRWLVRHLGENGLILAGGLLDCLCFVAFALVINWVVFLLLNIALGLSYYMLHSTLQTKATELAPGARGTAVSLFAFALFLGQGAGVAALGVVIDGAGYMPAFIICGVAMVLLALGFVVLARRITPAVPAS